MIGVLLGFLLFTFYPGSGSCQPGQPVVVATAYCLKGPTTSGPTTVEVHQLGGCIALSRSLAQDLGLKRGPGQYAYKFGAIIEVIGVGRFIFADLMPPQWRHYRVDIYYPTCREARVFGIKRCQIRVIECGPKVPAKPATLRPWIPGP
jgi:3D (Asp-Asp-Asp) domain-containing protein